MKIKNYIKCLYINYRRKKLKKNVVNNKHDALDLNDKEIKDYRKKGFSLSESYLYNLVQNDYHSYITTWEAYQPRIKVDANYFNISDDKYLFSLVYKEYIDVPKSLGLIHHGRLYSLNDDFCEKTFYKYALSKGGLVIKDRCGSDGFDVYVIRRIGDKLFYKGKEMDEHRLMEIVKRYKNGLIQTIIQQGDFENSIFGKSINTIRIISMRKQSSYEHEVVAALQRIGTEKSTPVDNFNQGGLTALIDLDTGKIGKATSIFSVDEKGNRLFYSNHPDTGAQIEGLIVPNWDEIKHTIGQISLKVPFFEYVAWDFVVKDDGYALIETNMKSSLNVFQIHRGMRDEEIGKKYSEKGFLERL